MSGWRTVSLGDFADSVDYGVTASASQQPSGPKFLRITDIQNGEVNWNTVPWCECDARSAANSRLKPGDIVFARTGATTGKSFLIRECPANAVFASYLIRVRAGASVEPCYLSHFFNSPNYWAQIIQSARGVAQPGVNASTLKTLKIPLPPLPEQRRIAAILDKADSISRKRQEAVKLTEELLRSVFLDMFGDPATNPKQFPYMTIGELASKFSDGPFGSNLKSSHYSEIGVRIVRLQNIGVGKFLDDDKAFISDQHFASLKKHECRPGDVLVGTMGDPNLRACIQPDWLKLALNKADCVQLRPNERYANAPYLCALLNQPETGSMAQDLIVGQTRLRISMGRLRGLRVPVPPLELQTRFARSIATIEKVRTAHKESQAESDTLFNSLLQSAFKGAL